MLGLGLALLLVGLVPCVACDFPGHGSTPTLSVVAPPGSSKATPLKAVVNVTAIFEPEDLDDFIPIFQRTLHHILNHSSIFTWTGGYVTATRDLKTMITKLCTHFHGDKSHIRVIIVFGRVSTIRTVNMLSQALRIPVIGYMLDGGDGYVQIHNPIYLSLQPSNRHLAKGLVSLLAINFWFRLTMITQEELRHDGFHRTFRDHTREGKWTIDQEIFISSDESEANLISIIGSLSGNSSRIFILHTTAALARRVFIAARKVFDSHARFAWIITQNAYTRDEVLLREYPLGTKAFLLNYDMRPEELLRDVLDLAMEALQGNDHSYSQFIREMGHSDSSYSSSVPSSSLTSYSSLSSSLSSLQSKSQEHIPSSIYYMLSGKSRKNKNSKGCWAAKSDTIYPQMDPVYSALKSTSIYGMTGLLAFDEDGFMNIGKYRVRNLVFDGRQSVWQDIGCVQGKDIRPFGIIWPGDARSLKAETEGKKRYRVVTNPVQPFVMTEAPHPDYAACLSDTPCLNLTRKYKSQEVVWEAIHAYEHGSGEDSELFTIQCCRGLTIDLLNKLASDLEFDFTLYIVQDETYGQKSENGTWSGMMKDLTDNTAHFAVGAFSITSQRAKNIDFTDPYFFSGFSIIYSDRTRETSMLAFLEPFSTEVWFAILVTAHITAVCMALFEWNSPFGLNPWGRKRNKNYSLASGLTMVFSVLFGHTVKTKSPKAWPTKLLQNLWAFAAIFIIASYTANLAAFIAGKHAGINYMTIQDSRLQDIRIGVLPGSAVHEVLKASESKLVSVANRYPVPKSDEGITWVIKGRLDALLGDYPILDYARAHLAPSCELKLISKIFGDDRYGIGLPRHSPLRAALSKKISEYHRIGYIDDLIDVHFADAHCFKKRISEEDSQLEVTHHAGLFVMLCVGFGVGVLVLLLEHLIYKFLVPYIRQCPETSKWRSVHLMFFSQRLQRIINSAELVSPHQSAMEMLGIMKNREFARLFQKSTIRRNRLADIAKTKRINRNFYDIVEKAKWLQEMKASGLMDDDAPATTPNIIEIPLSQLTVNVELGSSTLKLDNPGDSAASNVRKCSQASQCSQGKGRERKSSKSHASISDEDSSTSAESDDSLLGDTRAASGKSLASYAKRPSVSSSASVDQSSLSDVRGSRRFLHRKPRRHRSDASSSPECDGGGGYSSSPKRHNRSLSFDHASYHRRHQDDPSGHNSKCALSPGSSMPFATLVNELPSYEQSRHILRTRLPVLPPSLSPSSRSVFSRPSNSWNSDKRSSKRGKSRSSHVAAGESFGNVKYKEIEQDAQDLNATDEALLKSPASFQNHKKMLKMVTDDSQNLSGASASNCSSNKALLPKSSNKNLARSRLHKTRSYQDHLCYAAESAQAEASPGPFSLDTVTKEELLVLWKTSEIELNRRLETALQEKARLERRLALLQTHHSPV